MAYYLDLFNGNPETGGTSILGIITGSTARIEVTDEMEVSFSSVERLVNTDFVVVTEAALSNCNVSYAGLYAATSGGLVQFLHRVGSHFTIAKGNLVQFIPLALSFVNPFDMVSEDGAFMLSESGDQMVTQTT